MLLYECIQSALPIKHLEVSGISLIEVYNKYSGTEMEFRYLTFIPESILMGIKEISWTNVQMKIPFFLNFLFVFFFTLILTF